MLELCYPETVSMYVKGYFFPISLQLTLNWCDRNLCTLWKKCHRLECNSGYNGICFNRLPQIMTLLYSSGRRFWMTKYEIVISENKVIHFLSSLHLQGNRNFSDLFIYLSIYLFTLHPDYSQPLCFFASSPTLPSSFPQHPLLFTK